MHPTVLRSLLAWPLVTLPLAVPAADAEPVGFGCSGGSVWDNFLVQDQPHYTAPTWGGPFAVPGATRVTLTCTWYGATDLHFVPRASVVNTTPGPVGYLLAPELRYHGGGEEQVLCTSVTADTPEGTIAVAVEDDERCPA